MKMDADPQDKDLLILKMKAANFELAIENMELQKALLQNKIGAVKAELTSILEELKTQAKREAE